MVKQSERTAATTSQIIEAARKLFTERGFNESSIDDIAAAAGVTKGAVYHHFKSKTELFTLVVEHIQQELAAAPVPPPAPGSREPQLIADAVYRYLIGSTDPSRCRILLIDGPAVIGWQKWREIDYRLFGAGARAGLATWLRDATADQIDAATHLLMGAVTEAALVCATTRTRKKTALAFTESIRRMMDGLQPKSHK